MTMIFSPTGSLDVSTDPMELPETVVEKNIESGAMTRCTNLTLDRPGIASTRRGSEKLNAVAMQTDITRIIENAGTRYTLAGAYVYADETQIDNTQTAGTTWTATWYNPYNSDTQAIYAVNGTDVIRIEGSTVYQWGITAPTVAPTLAVGIYGGLTGEYDVVYTYVRKEGNVIVSESNQSPGADTAIDLTSQSLSITWTASSDAQVTHVRVYRTVADTPGVYYLIGDYAVGTTSTDDNTADASLGAQPATDHETPPAGTFVFGSAFMGQLFILKDNLLYYCKPNQPDYWPSDYYMEVSPASFPLKAGAVLEGQLYLASKSEIYQLQGSGASSYFPLPMGAICGTVAQEVFVPVKGVGLFHMGNDGLYQYTGGKDYRVPGFEPIWQGDTVGSLPALNKTYIANCWARAWHNKLYFGYPGGTDHYPKDVLVWDFTTKNAAHYQYSTTMRYLARDRTNDRLISADESGYLWSLEDVSKTTDNGTGISWQVQTKDFNPFAKVFPRSARYDVNLRSGTANGYIILNDTSVQTHAITSSRNNRKRLITHCTGDRLAVRITGTGLVDIYRAMVE